MGYESYNFKLQPHDDIDVKHLVNILMKLGYVKCGCDTFEKALECGFLEVLLEGRCIMLRTAKANDPSVILELCNDISMLSHIGSFEIYDSQLKQVISLNCFSKTFAKFELLHKEFLGYFPNVTHPIRCADVFAHAFKGRYVMKMRT